MKWLNKLWYVAGQIDVIPDRVRRIVGQARTVAGSTVTVLAAIGAGLQVIVLELGVEFPIVGQYGPQTIAALAVIAEGVRRLSTVIPEQRGIPPTGVVPREIKYR